MIAASSQELIFVHVVNGLLDRAFQAVEAIAAEFRTVQIEVLGPSSWQAAECSLDDPPKVRLIACCGRDLVDNPVFGVHQTANAMRASLRKAIVAYQHEELFPANVDPPPGWPPQVGRSAEPGDLTAVPMGGIR
jgi:hypothetical protein